MNKNENETLLELKDLLNRKRLPEIIAILNQHPNLNINELRDFNKNDILLCAILLKQGVFVDYIIKKDFDITQESILYLHHAIRVGDKTIINLLLDKMIANKNYLEEINKLDKTNENNVIHIAINYKISKSILKRLTWLGASWLSKNSENINPLYLLFSDVYYVNEVLDKELIDLILSSKDNFNFLNKNIFIIENLNYIIKNNLESKEVCEYLLEKIK